MSRIALSAALYNSHMAAFAAHRNMLWDRRLRRATDAVACSYLLGGGAAGDGPVVVSSSFKTLFGPNKSASSRSRLDRVNVEDASARATLFTSFA